MYHLLVAMGRCLSLSIARFKFKGSFFKTKSSCWILPLPCFPVASVLLHRAVRSEFFITLVFRWAPKYLAKPLPIKQNSSHVLSFWSFVFLWPSSHSATFGLARTLVFSLTRLSALDIFSLPSYCYNLLSLSRISSYDFLLLLISIASQYGESIFTLPQHRIF